MAKKYVKILDSDGDYDKTSRDEVNIRCTSNYGIVVHEIQSAHEEAERSKALCSASAQDTGARSKYTKLT